MPMRTPDKTIVFGSQNASTSTTGMTGMTPPPSPPPSGPVRTAREDLAMPESYSFVERPERGLAFAAISLALIGVAAAGTYFLLGAQKVAAHVEPVATTTITQAEVPTPAAPALTPTVTPADLPWDKPMVDAVKAPNLPKKIEAAQILPNERREPAAAPVPAPVQTAKEVPANQQQVDDAALERAGFYKALTPTAPTADVPDVKAPSAASTESTTHMEPTPTPAPSDVLPEAGIKH